MCNLHSCSRPYNWKVFLVSCSTIPTLKFSTISIKGLQVFVQCRACLENSVASPEQLLQKVGELKAMQSDFRVIPNFILQGALALLFPGQETGLRATLGQVIAQLRPPWVGVQVAAAPRKARFGETMTQQVSKGSQETWAGCQRVLLLLSINDSSWIDRCHI